MWVRHQINTHIWYFLINGVTLAEVYQEGGSCGYVAIVQLDPATLDDEDFQWHSRGFSTEEEAKIWAEEQLATWCVLP